jgi:Tol biopolymer transport system component
VSIEGGATSEILPDGKHSNFGVEISRDGKHLAFTSYDISTFERKILVVAFDGNKAGPVERTLPYNLVNFLKWAPDGNSLTYLSGRGVPNLWRMPLDGAPAQPITDFKSGRIFNYSWSQDGKSLLIVRAILNNDMILIRDTARS